MKLIINGKEEEIHLEENSVQELLKIKRVEMPEMVSVEINGRILSRKEYATTGLHEGDRIEFLYFMGGGGILWAGERTKPTGGSRQN